MKILMVHNEYGSHSGEESVVDFQVGLLREAGYSVREYRASSIDIPDSMMGKFSAASSSIYSASSQAKMKAQIADFSPDLVHVHNLYPLISPSVLPLIRKSGIPIVMSVHNYRLICPNGLMFSHNETCTRCSKGREHWCVIRNCENDLPKSIAYALRNAWARKKGYYSKNVDRFLCLTRFQRDFLVQNGVPLEKTALLPNSIAEIRPSPSVVSAKEVERYVAFLGRSDASKGLSVLLEAARLLPQISFRCAGFESESVDFDTPANVEIVGRIKPADVHEFLSRSVALVFPSIWFEGMPMTILETMRARTPTVCSDLGGLPEIVENDVNGLLFQAGNHHELAARIERLWESRDLCEHLSNGAALSYSEKFSEQMYLESLVRNYAEVCGHSDV